MAWSNYIHLLDIYCNAEKQDPVNGKLKTNLKKECNVTLRKYAEMEGRSKG